MGTVGYMSPEQVRGLAVDHRSDIFSFGAILYELLLGRKAFKRDTAADTMSAILKEEPPEPSESGRSLAPALDRVVKHCLEKDRNNRFQSAKDIVFVLSESSGQAPPGGAPGDRRLGSHRPSSPVGAAGPRRRGDPGRPRGCRLVGCPSPRRRPGPARSDHARRSPVPEPERRRLDRLSPAGARRRGRDDALLRSHSRDPPVRLQPEVRETRRRPAGRRAGASGRRRPRGALPEGGGPAAGDARGRGHRIEPPPLARHLQRRRERPDRAQGADRAALEARSLPAARRLGRRRRGRHPPPEPGGLRPLSAGDRVGAGSPSQQGGARPPGKVRRARRGVRPGLERTRTSALLRRHVRRRRPSGAEAFPRGSRTRALARSELFDRHLQPRDRTGRGRGAFGRLDPHRRPRAPPSGERGRPLHARLRPALRGAPRGIGAGMRDGPCGRPRKPRFPLLLPHVHAAPRDTTAHGISCGSTATPSGPGTARRSS